MAIGMVLAIKTDRRDSKGIACLLLLGRFHTVHCMSTSIDKVRAILALRIPNPKR